MQAIAPVPKPDESLEAYTIRTHRALSRYVKDPQKRNEIVWQQWHKHRGPTEEESLADQAFDADRYLRKRNVCVFAEHEAVDGQGRPRRYDLSELARIVRSCNHRIADYSGFSPISDGHTKDDPLPGEEPAILGYSGPYRLGMIGRKNPRWAIFSDEHHMREAAGRLASKPRRSVELWTFKNDPYKTHFDPIAAIGSETPRLSLPVKFTREKRDGAVVERYTFSAPALPGGGSTFLKKFQREGSAMLSNEDQSQIMQAILETPHFRFLERLMEKEEASTEAPGAPDQYMGDMQGYQEDEELPPEDVAEPVAPEAGGEAEDPIADLNDIIAAGAGGEEEAAPPPTVPQEEEEPELMRKRHTRQREGEESVAVKYSRLQAAHSRLVQNQGRLANKLLAMEKQSADNGRTATLVQLESKYPHFVELEQELNRTLYSRGASLSQKEFDAHVAELERYAKRADNIASMHGPDIPHGQLDRTPGDGERERYEARLAAEAVKIHTQAVNNGDILNYDECVEKAAERIKQSA